MKAQFFIPLLAAAVAHVALWLAFSQMPTLPALLRTEPVRIRVVDAPLPSEPAPRALESGSKEWPGVPESAAPKSAAPQNSAPLNAQPQLPHVHEEGRTEDRREGPLEQSPEPSNQTQPQALPSLKRASALSGASKVNPSTENSKTPGNPCGTLRVPNELLGQGLFPRRYLATFQKLPEATESKEKWKFSGFKAAPGTLKKAYLDGLLRRVFEKCIPALHTSVLPAAVQTEGEEFSFPIEFVE